MNRTHAWRYLRSTAAGAVAVFAAATGTVAAPVTWDSSAGGNGNTYDLVVDNTITWDAARAAAQSRGGDLATITSQAEQDFVESLMLSAMPATGSYWFGLEETSENVFTPVTGEASTYANWDATEPNNANFAETVGAILWTADGGPAELVARRGAWNDEPVSGYPTPGLPTPAQIDVLRGGYLVEIASDANGGPGVEGRGNAVPLPAAIYAFPMGAAFAGYFYRRMRRGV